VRNQFTATLQECAGHIAGGDEAAAELALKVINLVMNGSAGSKSKPKPATRRSTAP
jgi:hypothetical protein